MLKKLEKQNFDRVFAVMEESFPPDEYRPYEEQKTLLEEGRYGIYILPDGDSSDIKAFIAVWQFDDFAFVEHFAVNQKYRSQGLGSRILDEVKQELGCQICLEVELPETELAKRRIGFYERNGFVLNDYPYEQPPISAGRTAIPLKIMTSGGGVTEERFSKIRDILYREVYHGRDFFIKNHGLSNY